jgi:hypothetical protein
MTDIDLNETLNRCCKVSEAALLPVILETRPYFYYFGEYFPYMTWRVGADDITDEGSEETDIDSYLIIGRLIIAHITEGYDGENEESLYTYIPLLKTAFNSNINLQSDTYPIAQLHLIEARLGRTTGYKIFMDGGVKTIQVGCEFPLTCKFEQLIDYQYT